MTLKGKRGLLPEVWRALRALRARKPFLFLKRRPSYGDTRVTKIDKIEKNAGAALVFLFTFPVFIMFLSALLWRARALAVP